MEQIGINRRDEAVLVLAYEKELTSAATYGIAVAPWRLGGPVRTPTLLTREASVPHMAVGSTATVVGWVNATDAAHPREGSRLQLARIRSGSLDGVQTVEATGGGQLGTLELAPAPGGAVRAVWARVPAPSIFGPRPVEAVEEDLSDARGLFGAPLSVPWPAAGTSFQNVLGDLAVGPRGDEAVVWLTKPPKSRAESLYVSSRTPGGTFTAPQRLGSASGERAAVSIGARGRLTVVWNGGLRHRLLVASGNAGGGLSREPLRAGAGPHDEEEAPLLTTNSRGQAIAVWTVSRRGRRVVGAVSADGLHFSRPRRLSVRGTGINECSTSEGLLEAGPTGDAVAAWSCGDGVGARAQELSRFHP